VGRVVGVHIYRQLVKRVVLQHQVDKETMVVKAGMETRLMALAVVAVLVQ